MRAEVDRGILRVLVPKLAIDAPVEVDRATLVASFGPGEPLAVDNLIIASVVFALDRLVPRWTAPDAWTREFSVSVPVSDPNLWGPVGSDLAAMLRFLTGDRWQLRFTKRSEDPYYSDYRSLRLRIGKVEQGQLFSGGLDSYACAIHALTSSRTHIVLIGHQDQPGASAAQERLVRRLDADPRFRSRMQLRTVRIAPTGAGPREPTSRSRSLVFLALALYSIRSLELDVPVVVPENGFIAINPPLTLARIGASSTRTTHPHFLMSLQEIWRKVGIKQTIHNPWEFQTKGEVLEDCGDVDVMRAGINDSVSCAHAGRRTNWIRRDRRNCGYCWPCLIRRASVNRVGADDGQAYGLDVLRDELPLHRDGAADLRALLTFLRDCRSDRQLRNRMLLAGPLVGDRSPYLDVVKRGIKELRDWISTGSVDLRKLGNP